ncbi:MAG: hypothetical protein ACTSRW_05450 [Candidatus Helarchaeota archaeon]
MSQEPKVVKVIHETGALNDELDWEITKYLTNLGIGYTPCHPSLVELEGGKQAIQILIDKTAVLKDGVYGYGIIGKIFIEMPKSPSDLRIIWMTPKEELESKGNEVLKTAQPQKRPKRY